MPGMIKLPLLHVVVVYLMISILFVFVLHAKLRMSITKRFGRNN